MNILTITTPNMENGLGCRVTMWVAGCRNKCEGCHNKHTWDFMQGSPLIDRNVKEKIFSELDKDYIQGLTISGGDPLTQSNASLEELYDFLVEFKQRFPEKDIWIYTGLLYEDIIKNQLMKNIISKCNIMIDGPFVKELHDSELAFRGSKNQRIIDIESSIATGVVNDISKKFD